MVSLFLFSLFKIQHGHFNPVYVHYIVALFFLRYEKAKQAVLALFCIGQG